MTTTSVLLASFNGAGYIEAQLQSILSGTLLPDEIIVSDDGSRDETLAVVSGYAAHSPVPLRLLSHSGDSGVTANFTNAMRHSSGEILVLSDQDDIWHPERLERALTALEMHPHALLVHSDADLIDAQGNPLGLSLFEALAVDHAILDALQSSQAFSTLLRRNVVTGATVAFRRELLEDALPIPAHWVHDEWLAILAASRGGVLPLTERLIGYRQHGRNQIGVRKATLGYLLQRLGEPDAGRTARLAERATSLGTRLSERGLGAAYVDAAQKKAAFEQARAALPAARLGRLGPVLRLARTGGYRRFASQGRRDVLRDLVQPR